MGGRANEAALAANEAIACRRVAAPPIVSADASGSSKSRDLIATRLCGGTVSNFFAANMSICLEGCSAALLADDGREYMMGIDEAGRGPTLGPMVYGSAFCAVEDEDKLRAMGFNDSKQLTEAKRDQLWEELQSVGFIGWRIRVLDAPEISEGMLRRHQK